MTRLIFFSFGIFGLVSSSAFSEVKPKEIKFSYTAAQATQLGEAGLFLQKVPASVKTRAAAREWQGYVTPNFAHPPAFTYRVTGDLFKQADKVLLAAIRADEFVKKGASKYSCELKLLTSEEAVLKATQVFYDNAGFGKFEKSELSGKMARVFENPKKRTLYGGVVSAEMGKGLSYEANLVLVVDSETSEFTGLGHGDLLTAFEVSTENDN